MKKTLLKWAGLFCGLLLLSSFTDDTTAKSELLVCPAGLLCNIDDYGNPVCVAPELDNGTTCSELGGGGSHGGGSSDDCEHPEMCPAGLTCILDVNGNDMCVFDADTYSGRERTVMQSVKDWFNNLW